MPLTVTSALPRSSDGFAGRADGDQGSSWKLHVDRHLREFEGALELLQFLEQSPVLFGQRLAAFLQQLAVLLGLLHLRPTNDSSTLIEHVGLLLQN